MQLPSGRVYIWNQKIFEPIDNNLFIVLSLATSEVLGNTNQVVSVESGGMQEIQTINYACLVDIDIKSRGQDAITRKDEILMAINSVYAEQQYEANGFMVLRNSVFGFKDLSGLDGSAIPYRFRATFRMFYQVTKYTSVPYFSTFPPVQITTDSP